MNVNLSPELERRIADYVASHGHEAVHSIVESALADFLAEVETEGDLDSLRSQLREAEAQLDRGEGIERDEHSTDSLVRDIHERGLKRLVELRKTGTEG